MRNMRMSVVALVCAGAMFVGGTAWGATYETFFDGNPTFDGEQYAGFIGVEGPAGCLKGRVVKVFQIKNEKGDKRDLGSGKTNAEGFFSFLGDRQPSEDFGGIFAKVTKEDLNARKTCGAALSDVDVV